MVRRITRTTLSGTEPKKAQKSRKRDRENRNLDAYAIAEKTIAEKPKLARHRLGSPEDDEKDTDDRGFKRQKQQGGGGDEDDSGNESGTNEWWNGRVNPDNDSEIDSDEAFGESDEERYDGYKLSESKSKPKTKKKGKKSSSRATGDIDLLGPSSDEEDDDDDLGDDGAALGDDAVDLATMLDDAVDASEVESESEGSDEGSDSDEDDDNFGSESDNEGQMEDDSDTELNDNRLAELHDIINSLHPTEKKVNKKTAREVSSLELGPISELGVATSTKLTLNDVMGTITDKEMRKTLKSVIKRSKSASGPGTVPGKLEVPLPKLKQAQLSRTAATTEANKTLDRWVETVKTHRRAEHLSFPLVDPTAETVKGVSTFLPTSATKPMNDLESAIQNILVESGLNTGAGKDDDDLRAFDELEAKKMTVEEVMAARKALRMQRDLLFREEVRAKRVKKIKSKSYRRVHRKERERAAEKEREELVANGVNLSDDDREKNERRRAEERMGAKHRDSKWAKGMKESGRTVWDEEAKAGVTEMARRNEELRRRIAGKVIQNNEESDLGSEFEDENIGFDSSDDEETRQKAVNKHLDRIDELHADAESSTNTRLSSLKFMQRAEAARKAENEAEIDGLRRMTREGLADESSEDETMNTGRMSFGPKKVAALKKPTIKRNEFEEREEEDSDNGDVLMRIGSDDEDETPARAGQVSTQVRTESKSTYGQTAPTTEVFSSLNPWAASSISTVKAASTATADADRNTWTMPKGGKKQSQSDKTEALFTNNAAPIIPISKLETRSKSSSKLERKGLAKTKIGGPTGSLEMLSDSSEDEEDSSSESKPSHSTKLQRTLESAISRNESLMEHAFGGADVELEFEREKEQAMEDDDDQVIDNTLPGWGSWTGSGVSGKKSNKSNKIKNQQGGALGAGKQIRNGKGPTGSANSTTNKSKFITTIAGIKPQNRKDSKLKNVIINERTAKINATYQSDTLPFPFTSREEYERSIRMPIGAEWTSLKSKPRVTVKPGSVIRPLEKPVA